MVQPGSEQVADIKKDAVSGRLDSSVSNQLFANPTDFSSTLKLAANTGEQSGDPSMRAFDRGGAPMIVDACNDKNANGVNDVVSSVKQNGRVVREHMECGPDTVVGYDEKGVAHRFKDEKITKLPVDFSSIPDWRLKEMNTDALDLIRSKMVGLRPDGGPDGMVSFNDVSDMMKQVGKMEKYTEVEKARLWSEVRNLLQSRNVPILDADEKPEMIDSWKGSSDPWHAIITMNDGYHGDRLINMSPEQASKAIKDHEEGAEAKDMPWPRNWVWNTAHFVLGTNTGDINASEGQLRALRTYRDQGTFSAYADEWTKQFVRADRDKFGWPIKK